MLGLFRWQNRITRYIITTTLPLCFSIGPIILSRWPVFCLGVRPRQNTGHLNKILTLVPILKTPGSPWGSLILSNEGVIFDYWFNTPSDRTQRPCVKLTGHCESQLALMSSFRRMNTKHILMHHIFQIRKGLTWMYVPSLCSNLFSCLIHVHSFVFHHFYPSSVFLPIGSASVKMFSAPLTLFDVLGNVEYIMQ